MADEFAPPVGVVLEEPPPPAEKKLFAVFIESTGEIVRSGETLDPVEMQAMFPGEVSMEIPAPVSSGAFHVADGVLAARPVYALVDLPAGTPFSVMNAVTGAEYWGDLPSVGLEIDIPGTWLVSATPPWPYQRIVDETVVVG